MKLLVGILLLVTGIVGWYVTLRRRYNALIKELPEDASARAEFYWQWLTSKRRHMTLLGAVCCSLSSVGIVIALNSLPSVKFALHAFGPAFWLMFLAFIVTSWLAYYPFDRALRGNTWSVGTYLRWMTVIPLWTGGAFPVSWLIGLEVTRQIAVAFPSYPMPPLGTAGLLISGFGLSFLLLTRFLPLLLHPQPLANERILAMVCDLSEKAGIKPPKLWLLPCLGGKMPLAVATWRSIFVTDFLCEQLKEGEMKALLAHELAHQKFQHPYRRAFIMGIFVALASLVLSFIPWASWSDREGMLIEFAALAAFWLFLRRLYLQWHREEWKADEMAAQLVGSGALVAQTLEKIHALAFLPSTFPKGLRLTHPSLQSRLENLRWLEQTDVQARDAQER